MVRILMCEMTEGCVQPVTMLDQKGYIYCTEHGLDRRGCQPCRKLRPHEVKQLERGEALRRY